jgi:hypothetical protein
MCPLPGKALQISGKGSMYNISKALMKPTAIPPIRQKKLDKRLFIITAGSAILLGLNAMAADASPADTPAAPGARNQQDIRQEMREHWEKMSPEEREQVRNKMKEHWNNMSPEERQQFKRDLGKQDGVPAPHEGNSGDSTGDAGRPAKPVGSIDK